MTTAIIPSADGLAYRVALTLNLKVAGVGSTPAALAADQGEGDAGDDPLGAAERLLHDNRC